MRSEQIAVRLESGRRLLIEAQVQGEEQVAVSLPNFASFTDSIIDIGKTIAAAIEAVKPDSAEVEIGVDATLESGQLTALLVKGSGTANMKVTLRWGKT